MESGGFWPFYGDDVDAIDDALAISVRGGDDRDIMLLCKALCFFLEYSTTTGPVRGRKHADLHGHAEFYRSHECRDFGCSS